MKQLALITAAVIALTTTPARTHDHARPDLDGWYPTLQSRKGPCCDGSDAQHISDVEWRITGNHYQVFLEGDWRDVDDSAVVQGPNLDGTALVWSYYLNGEKIGIRCFMPGTGS
jgi:hypothetical protein